jgi:hydrogenase-4 membrane subunit HyfE
MSDSTDLFLLYVAAVVVPLMFQSWRVAILGLGAQGLLLGAILASHHQPWSAQLVFEYVYLFAIRGVLLPWYFFHRKWAQGNDKEFVLIRKNLFQWLLAALLVLLAFMLGEKLAPENAEEAWQVGAAASGVLIGLLILCHQSGPLGQIVGIFTIESGIGLIELLSPHAMPFPAAVGVSAVFVLLMLTCGMYLGQLPASTVPSEPGSTEDKGTL